MSNYLSFYSENINAVICGLTGDKMNDTRGVCAMALGFNSFPCQETLLNNDNTLNLKVVESAYRFLGKPDKTVQKYREFYFR